MKPIHLVPWVIRPIQPTFGIIHLANEAVTAKNREVSPRSPMKLIATLVILCFTLACGKPEATPTPAAPSPQPELSSFTDVDGNVYAVRKIGSNWWMTQNFKATRTAAGAPIEGIYAYDDNPRNAETYGRLYTWSAAGKVTPPGWHLATQAEWEELIGLAGGRGRAGGTLKESGFVHWSPPNTGATNTLGFTLLAGGFRGPDGKYYTLKEHCTLFGSANQGQEAFYVATYHDGSYIKSEVSPEDKTSGIAFALRFVKDR